MWVGGNSALPIAIEHQVIAQAVANLPTDIPTGEGGLLIRDKLLTEVIRRNPGITVDCAQAGYRDSRAASIPWVRGQVTEEECARCGCRDKDYPRRQCEILKAGPNPKTMALWKKGPQTAPYQQKALCAGCTGGGTPQEEAVEPFLVFDVGMKTYRPPRETEFRLGPERVQSQLQQHWDRPVKQWRYMPSFYTFGICKPFQPATREDGDADAEPPTPSPKAATPSRRPRGKSSAPTPPPPQSSPPHRHHHQSSSPPPPAGFEEDLEVEQSEGSEGWSDHEGADGGDYPSDGSGDGGSDDDDPHGGGGGPWGRKPRHRGDRYGDDENERAMSKKSKQLKETGTVAKYVQEALRKKAINAELNPTVKASENPSTALAKMDKDGKAHLVNQVYRSLANVEEQQEQSLEFLHEMYEYKEAMQNPGKKYSGWTMAHMYMEALLGDEHTALARLWASGISEWRKRIWAQKVKVATGTGYMTKYSMKESIQQWLVERLHGLDNQKREAKKALLARAEALRQFDPDRTAIATLEQLVEIQEALRALTYGVSFNRTLMGDIIWDSLSNQQQAKMSDALKSNRQRKKDKSPGVLSWLFELDKLNSRVNLEQIREMASLADSFRQTTRPRPAPRTPPPPATPRRTRGGTLYVMQADGWLQPAEEGEDAEEGLNDTVAAAGQEDDPEEEETTSLDDQGSAHGSLKAAPVGQVGPKRRPFQQHRNGRVNPTAQAQPGPPRIQVQKGTMFAVPQPALPATRPIHCYNCGQEGHKRFECPEQPKSRQEQGAIMQRLQQLRPNAAQTPPAALIQDRALACAARSVDLSTEENTQQAVEELGAQAVFAVQDFLYHMGELPSTA